MRPSCPLVAASVLLLTRAASAADSAADPTPRARAAASATRPELGLETGWAVLDAGAPVDAGAVTVSASAGFRRGVLGLGGYLRGGLRSTESMLGLVGMGLTGEVTPATFDRLHLGASLGAEYFRGPTVTFFGAAIPVRGFDAVGGAHARFDVLRLEDFSLFARAGVDARYGDLGGSRVLAGPTLALGGTWGL